MGQITGNDKDFPTIKQVNDALSGAVGGTLDISEYLEDLFALTNTKIDVFDTELTNQHLLELIDKILEVKPTVLKGSVDETLLIGDNFSFETIWNPFPLKGLRNEGNCKPFPSMKEQISSSSKLALCHKKFSTSKKKRSFHSTSHPLSNE